MNRKDRDGSNVFEGGFLGLDNIGVFDRSAPLPTGGYLEQADGTAWMALFCQNMLEIALELAAARPGLRGHGHEVLRALPLDRGAMDHIGEHEDGLWDEEDGFFYDVLRLPDGTAHAAQGALDGRAAPAVRGDRHRAGGCSSGSRDSRERGSSGSSRRSPT